MNDGELDEKSAETQAQHQAGVKDLIDKISKDTSLVMTAEAEETVESLRANKQQVAWCSVALPDLIFKGGRGGVTIKLQARCQDFRQLHA